MEGEELSVFALTDGEEALTLLPLQDHKRIGEGDTGANTGGMGAYAPVSIADTTLLERIEREIFVPILGALREDGNPFRGLLYAGLMLTAEGPKVVEFNCRFGDPETQALIPDLGASLREPVRAIAEGDTLNGATLEWSEGAALTTILGAEGYPERHEVGHPITIPEWVEEAENIVLFHGRTALEGGELVTAGGRVLAVTGLGPTIAEAAARSRAAAEAITFRDKYYRRDIGWRELERIGAKLGAVDAGVTRGRDDRPGPPQGGPRTTGHRDPGRPPRPPRPGARARWTEIGPDGKGDHWSRTTGQESRPHLR